MYLDDFKALVERQIARAVAIKNADAPVDFSKKERIVVGYLPGDGIGPIITDATVKVLEKLMAEEVASGRLELRAIPGLTLEERIAANAAVPAPVLEACKACDVLLKGPMTTPDKKSGIKLGSANVGLRQALDLYANVRPVCIPEQGIDWTFFRENTEGEYVLGNEGVAMNENGQPVADGEKPELCFDFKVTTLAGTRRIARAAFEYAKARGNQNVSIVTKANVIKETDGLFLETCYDVAKSYPDIHVDDWYIDIATANLIKEGVRERFNVFVLPNLYGDIITDEAAQIQGGVGTAGSANIGDRYAMFEAIHGSAPRMITEGRGKYANPESLLRAAVMLLRHIGYVEKADKLDVALTEASKGLHMTSRPGGNTAEEFTEKVVKLL